MSGRLFVVGLSWRTAAVDLRERLAFADEELSDALSELLVAPEIDEAMIISTCNRVEVFGVTSTQSDSVPETATAVATSFLARSRSVESEDLSAGLYEFADEEAVRHVFRVAAALDSMVVGESQILGQVKAAFGIAVANRSTGPLLGRFLENSFRVAKRVRSETGVSRGASNISTVAVELVNRVFGDLADKTVVLLGAGKMSAVAARHLRAGGAQKIIVLNRSPERAEELARSISAETRPWDQLADQLATSDVVITSTGSKQPILDKALMKQVVKKRRYRPIVLVDIAVPRDVDRAVGSLDGVYLFDIDDLRVVVEENLKERTKEAAFAEEIVDHEVGEFSKWLSRHKVVPTIRSLREHFSRIAEQESEKVVEQLRREHTPEQRERAVRRLASVIVNKLLHTPMSTLNAEDVRSVEALVVAAERLFALEPSQTTEDNDHKHEEPGDKEKESA